MTTVTEDAKAAGTIGATRVDTAGATEAASTTTVLIPACVVMVGGGRRERVVGAARPTCKVSDFRKTYAR